MGMQISTTSRVPYQNARAQSTQVNASGVARNRNPIGGMGMIHRIRFAPPGCSSCGGR